MTENRSVFSKLVESGRKALSPWNILFKLFSFFIFGFLTAFGYIITNLNKVWMEAQATGVTTLTDLIFEYVKAIWRAVRVGFFIGLSTVWDSITNLGTIIDEVRIGTIIYTVLVLFFASITVYAVFSFIADILDATAGKHYSMTLVFFVSVIFVILISPLANWALDGRTLTSPIEQEFNQDSNLEQINQTPNITEEVSAPTIDLSGG